MTVNERIILALDGFKNKEDLLLFAGEVAHRVYAIKLHEALDRFGPCLIRELRDLGARRVWPDMKFFDTPDTVRLRARAYRDLGADILTVHALGGTPMMRAAKESNLEIFAVTLLTSFRIANMPWISSIENAAYYLTCAAKAAGVDGVVSSVHTANAFAKLPEFKGLKFVTPGIRWEEDNADDHEHVTAPSIALEAGAQHIVVGRMVTLAPDPIAAFEWLDSEVRNLRKGDNDA